MDKVLSRRLFRGGPVRMQAGGSPLTALGQRSLREIMEYRPQAPEMTTTGITSLAEESLPMFEQFVGGGEEARQAAQARILADISRAGLAFAGGVTPSGERARGSMVSQLAQAFGEVPAGLQRESAAMQQMNRETRASAIKYALQRAQTLEERDLAMQKVQAEIGIKLMSAGEGGVKTEVVGSDATGRFLINKATGETIRQITPAVGEESGIKTEVVGSDATGRFLINKATGERIADITPPSAGEGGAGPFGSGLTGRSLGIMLDVGPKIEAGLATPEEIQAFKMATHHYTQVGDYDPQMGRYRNFPLPDDAQRALSVLGGLPPMSAAGERQTPIDFGAQSVAPGYGAPAAAPAAPTAPIVQPFSADRPEVTSLPSDTRLQAVDTPANQRPELVQTDIADMVSPEYRSDIIRSRGNLQEGLGTGAAVRNKINKVFSALTGTQPFPATQEQISRVNGLMNEALVGLVNAVPGRPNMIVYERFSKELIDPASPFQNVDFARAQLTQMIDIAETDIQRADIILANPDMYRQQDVVEARQAKNNSLITIRKIETILDELAPAPSREVSEAIMQRSLEQRQRRGQ